MPAAQAPSALLGSSSPSSRTEALLVNSSDQLHGSWHREHELNPLSSSGHQPIEVFVESGALHAASSPVKLEDLQPDVLQGVLLFLRDQDVAQLKQASSRLRCSILQACQHWAPKVEGWLMADHNSSSLLRRLRDLEPQQHQPCWEQQPSQQPAAVQKLGSPAAAFKILQEDDSVPLQLPGALMSYQISCDSSSYSSSEEQITDQQQQAEAAAASLQPLQGTLQLNEPEAAPAGAMLKRWVLLECYFGGSCVITRS
jgi:hypothetical protein